MVKVLFVCLGNQGIFELNNKNAEILFANIEKSRKEKFKQILKVLMGTDAPTESFFR